MKNLLWTALFLCCIACGLHARTIFVPDDYPVIQDAINAAAPGDTVLVRPGIYIENIDFSGKAIALRSTDGPEVTVIDGGQPLNPDLGTVVTFQRSEQASSVIEGFRIANGVGSNAHNHTRVAGGILCAAGAGPTIAGNIISGNTAVLGGGIACVDGSSPVITDNRIVSNTSLNTGGIHCGANCSPIIDGNVIAKNGTRKDGGGITLRGGSRAVITGNSIVENAGGDGGGIYCWEASPRIEGNLIANNTSRQDAGGITCTHGYAVVVINRITGNSSRFGGLFFGYGDGIAAGNIISGNTAQDGGGIHCLGSTPALVGNTIVANVATARGGGIHVDRAGDAIILNTILWGNAAPMGKELCLTEYGAGSSAALVSHSDIDGGNQSVHVDPNCVLNWGPGCIDADPLFAAEAEGDFHLTVPSPCRDSGSNQAVTRPVDFEGDPRIAFKTVDMGADEFFFHLYRRGDVVPGSVIDVVVVGTPAENAHLFLGTGIADPPSQTQHGPFHLPWPPLRMRTLGAIPADGVLVFPLPLPPGTPSGSQLPFQTLVGPWGGVASRLTNLLVLEVM